LDGTGGKLFKEQCEFSEISSGLIPLASIKIIRETNLISSNRKEVTMPTKATGSHPISGLIALLAGSVLSKYVWSILPPIGTASQMVLNVIDSTILPVPTNTETAGMLVVFLAVTMVWEAAHFFRNWRAQSN
jgi:hypothetical protein